MIGPTQFSMNGQMQRAFRIRDRYNLQLNITASNPLNHVMITGVYSTSNYQHAVRIARDCESDAHGGDLFEVDILI